MTDHPLTYDICEQLAYDICYKLADTEQYDFSTDDMDIMQAAADWQLEQVIAHILAAEWFGEPGYRISQLHQAMRPTQENN